MYLTSEVKKDIFKKHGGTEKNTGSSESQVALFTMRIDHLTGHLKKNKKDFSAELSLVKLVGKRRSLLNYLQRKDVFRYRAIIKELEIYGTVEVDSNQTIVSIVGNMIAESKGTMAKIMNCLKDYPIRMVSYGGSRHNVSLLLDAKYKNEALKSLNEGLFEW